MFLQFTPAYRFAFLQTGILPRAVFHKPPERKTRCGKRTQTVVFHTVFIPQALRCPKLKNHFSAEDAQSKAAGILNRLSPAIAAQRHIIAHRRYFSGVENCNFPRLFHTEKRQRPGVENLGPVHSRLEKNKSPLRNGL